MKKHILLLLLICSVFTIESNAQYYGRYYMRPRARVRVGPGVRRSAPPQKRNIPPKPPFIPTLNISIGYGFPNLDKNHLAEFYDFYKGSASQTGPITGAIDYQFSPNISLGLMGTYGKVSAPYYSYSSQNNTPDFTGNLENWSVMFNMMTYFSTYTRKVEPYLRTALGINNWKQNYVDETGAKVYDSDNPTEFAYQVSLGARLNVSKNAGFYVEGGYGKYILNGGLTFKF